MSQKLKSDFVLSPNKFGSFQLIMMYDSSDPPHELKILVQEWCLKTSGWYELVFYIFQLLLVAVVMSGNWY